MSQHSKDLKHLFKELTLRGWTIEKKKKHNKAYPPEHLKDAPFLTISQSPSCPRAFDNIKAQIAAIEERRMKKVVR